MDNLFAQVTSLKISLSCCSIEIKNNLLFWNVKTDPLSEAKNTIKRLVNLGWELEVKDTPPFSVIQKASNFIRIKVTDNKDRYGIMKNAKKFRGK